MERNVRKLHWKKKTTWYEPRKVEEKEYRALRPVDDEKKTYPAGAPGTNPYFFGPIVNYSDSAPGSDKKTEIRLDGVITYHLHALNLSDTEKYRTQEKKTGEIGEKLHDLIVTLLKNAPTVHIRHGKIRRN